MAPLQLTRPDQQRGFGRRSRLAASTYGLVRASASAPADAPVHVPNGAPISAALAGRVADPAAQTGRPPSISLYAPTLTANTRAIESPRLCQRWRVPFST